MNFRGQVSIFVIIALVLVGGIIMYFTLREVIGPNTASGEFQSIFNRHHSCIETALEDGTDLIGLGGGRIATGSFEQGSDYAPFSSHLTFLGTPVKYWYSLSANGIFKEQVPSKTDIEGELARYVETELDSCDFSDFYAQGYLIEMDEPKVTVDMRDSVIRAQVIQRIRVSREEASAVSTSEDVEIESALGRIYTSARALYDKQQSSAFLEHYAVDVLRNYAPVDGVSLSCAPQTWKTQEVVSNIRTALSTNFESIKFTGNYYDAQTVDSYFVVDQSTRVPVRLIYDTRWPSVIEVTPADESIMIAKPVGNDPALGVMGFCYVPYHFVYDVRVPVLFQFYDGDTLFQFPVVVTIDNNLPRAAGPGLSSEEDVDVCSFNTNSIRVATYDSALNPVEADISYQCFDSLCPVGKTTRSDDEAVVNGVVPGCVNGLLHAHAEGYADTQILFSSNSETNAEIILDKLHEVTLNLELDDSALSGTALIQFISPTYSTSVSYPDSRTVKLKEDLYNITVYVYGNSSVVIPSSTKTQCQEVSRPGLSGLFGGTKEQCFDVTIPATTIDYALLGGGNLEAYLLESELERGSITIRVPSVPAPTTLEQVQYSFQAVERALLEVNP